LPPAAAADSFMAGMEALKAASGLIEAAFSQSDKCILFYSGGKDSACVLNLLEKTYSQNNIHLVFMPFVDGLKETELVMDMAKKHGYSGVHQYQHWTYFRDKANGAYCPKQGKPKKLIDVYREVREDFGDLPIFTGAKRSDGMWRRFNTMNTAKGGNYASIFMPIYSWSKYDVLLYIRQNGLDYIKAEGGRISGVDLSPKYILWARDNQPQSYEAIKREFPFIDAVFKRQELKNE